MNTPAAVSAWNPPSPVVGIGMISGTSADGIDAAAVELSEEDGRLRARVLAFESLPYPDTVRDALFRCFADQATTSELCVLNARIGELFADAAERVAARAGKPAFVASHGQTVWHQPPAAGLEAGGYGTLQLGEAARIATRLGVPVVSDFRQQDMALGGQGAPLVPYLDHLLLSDPHRNRAVQNLGGIGNVTYLRAGGTLDDVIAFDTGPANALIDAAAVLVSGGALRCDEDGRLAASAPVDAGLLERLLREPYLALPPPKSTGRELFSAALVQSLWDEGHRGPGLVSTLTQYTVETVAGQYARWLGSLTN
jgi:anhydro-N-acetylmuramic acid kinase